MVDSYAVTGLFVAAVVGFLFAMSVFADAHMHELYDPYCCNDKDCAPAEWVKQRPDGTYMAKTKFGVMVFSKNITPRPSRDGRNHACVYQFRTVAPGIKEGRCLYLAGGV